MSASSASHRQKPIINVGFQAMLASEESTGGVSLKIDSVVSQDPSRDPQLENEREEHQPQPLHPRPSPQLEISESPLNSTPIPPEKQKRNQISLEKKLELIKYDDMHPEESKTSLAKLFQLPRPTVIGILNQKDKLLEHARKNASRICDLIRIRKSKVPAVEATLRSWLKSLEIQGVRVSDEKIYTQAIEVYRLFSCNQDPPMSPCLFSSTWRTKFLKHHRVDLNLKNSYPTPSERITWHNKVILWKLDEIHPDDMYTCDLTNKGASDDLGGQVLKGMEPNTTPGDLTVANFKEWLHEFDRSVNRDIYLFVNKTIGSYSMGIQGLKYLKILVVPNGLSGLMPMSIRLMKEFKANYHKPLITNLGGAYKPPPDSLGLAWSNVQSPIIQKSFDLFRMELCTLEDISLDRVEAFINESGPAENDLRREMKSQLKEEDYRLYKYYIFQDGDTGPPTRLETEAQKK
ncbi:hypothetical protein BGX27_006842 [Mortierella sp. AM989]|nr:hypothetical protein BGX27_006842 [Mortierella sp. AM989]